MPSRLVQISGTRYQVGVALGQLARPLMATYLEQSSTWRALQPWKSNAYLQELSTHIKRTFPKIWEELQGMADGLQMQPDDVLLWNCRGDLLQQTHDGCTSIALYGTNGNRWIAHNEDGDPFLFNKCHIVDIKPDDAPGYVSFYYPGSLPGHTFAANRAGLIQTINNLRAHARGTGVPRMVLARAVLDCSTLDQAVTLLRDTARSGAFHHTLGSVTSPDLISVEAIPGRCSVLPLAHSYGHANHLMHVNMHGLSQTITGSSAARQQRVQTLLNGLESNKDQEQQLVSTLFDRQGLLPIFRTDAHDPDEENTLATAIFHITHHQATLHIYNRNGNISHDITIVNHH